MFKICSHSSFQVYDSVPFHRVTMLNIGAQECTVTGGLFPLASASPIYPQSLLPYPHIPGGHYSMLFL